jgi:hypothetical protein
MAVMSAVLIPVKGRTSIAPHKGMTARENIFLKDCRKDPITGRHYLTEKPGIQELK